MSIKHAKAVNAKTISGQVKLKKNS